MPPGILAKKLGMTRILLEDGRFVPVTILQAGPCAVTLVRTRGKDGYDAVQMGFLPQRKSRVNKPMSGFFAKASVSPYQILREFKADDADQFSPGQEVLAEQFEENSLVDVRGTTKGNGFAGTIKRWGHTLGPMSHGSKSHRRPGSGGGTDAARTFKGKHSPGHMGHENLTVQNLLVVRRDPERHLLFLKGAVPGPNGGIVEVRPSSVASSGRSE